jgi:hypothetical protein
MTPPRYYRVSPRFWHDTEGWSDDERLLALYLLTCPQRTTEGLFPFRSRYAQADLEWVPERFDKAFAQLLERDFVRFDATAKVLLIVKALKYQAPANDNQAKYAVKVLDELPSTPLTSDFKQLAERFSERLLNHLPNGFGTDTQTDPDHSSSLTQAQALSPPPPLGGGGVHETVTSVEAALVLEGFTPAELEPPLKLLRSELSVTPDRIKSPVAWTRTLTKKFRAARARAEELATPWFTVIDGEPFTWVPNTGLLHGDDAEREHGIEWQASEGLAS